MPAGFVTPSWIVAGEIKTTTGDYFLLSTSSPRRASIPQKGPVARKVRRGHFGQRLCLRYLGMRHKRFSTIFGRWKLKP